MKISSAKQMNRMISSVVILATFLGFSYAQLEAFKLSDCGTDPDRVLKINSLHLSPIPLDITDTFTFNYDITLQHALQRSTRLNIDFKTNAAGTWQDLKPEKFIRWWSLYEAMYKMPCAYGFFHQLTWGCPDIMTTNKLGCMCPLKAGRYTLPVNTSTKLPTPWHSVFLNFADGDYMAYLRLSDSRSENEVGCIKVESTMKTGNPVPTEWGLSTK